MQLRDMDAADLLLLYDGATSAIARPGRREEDRRRWLEIRAELLRRLEREMMAP